MASFSKILDIIGSAFKPINEPLTPLPSPLIITGSQLRGGLSAKDIASRIISRQSESGRQFGDVFADGGNNEETMELIRIEEIVNAILTEAKIEVVIPPGTPVTTIGVGNLGMPVISQGVTTSMAIGNAILR